MTYDEVSSQSSSYLPSWSHLGAILEPSWGPLGPILGPSWGHLGPSWDHFGGPKCGKNLRKMQVSAMLGHLAIILLSCCILGPSWGHLGAFLGHLGAILGRRGAILAPSRAILGAS